MGIKETMGKSVSLKFVKIFLISAALSHQKPHKVFL